MENEFIPHKEALALKELGLDEPCVGTYHDNNGGEIKFSFGMLQYPKRNSQANTVEGTFIGERGCYAPLYQQAFSFFREKDMWAEVKVEDSVEIGTQKFYWLIFGEYKSLEGNGWVRALKDSNDVYYTTYEEAELACLRKLIEIVNQNKDE